MVSSVIGSYSSTASGNGAGFAVLLGMRLKKIIAIEPMAPIVTTIFSMWSMINTTTASNTNPVQINTIRSARIFKINLTHSLFS